ncbi:hypothetical protein VT50_0210530 [Streptomyces antioxidans]|uniref:UspA domain-containing protein n=1 Tax=Streptomyces antioxidans TaxID=1507734 RepID=A0A1V4D866_9ACTN|nr:universal stress protein [Streptomyces antioxidans]OPF80973.1 hypothetical protein VT50_0210530 [Streptomyces antioxidans]
MSHPITAGVDGSPESLAAAHWAAREARCRRAPLRLIHAWMLPPQTARTAQSPEMRRLWAQEALEDTKARLLADCPGMSIATELVAETPVEALVARGAGSEMLVLGSHGRGAVGGFLLGSVGLHVLALSKSPVVLVRRNGGARTGTGPRDVVVGIQDPPESAAPIEFAFATAAAHGTGVCAVRAWAPVPVFAHGPRSRRLLDETQGTGPGRERQRLAEAVELWREKYADVPVTERVERGHATEVLLGAAAEAELTVVGRPIHRPPAGPRLGHVAHALLHHAACPVAVVPHAP